MKRQDTRPARSEFLEPEASLDRLASAVLGAAVEVHKSLGPGLLESVYEYAVCVELSLRGVTFRRQVSVAFEYKGHPVGVQRVVLTSNARKSEAASEQTLSDPGGPGVLALK